MLAALTVLVLGLSITALVGWLEFHHADQQDEDRFNQLAERVRGEVARRVTVYRYGLMGTRSVFAASDSVDREEFIQLVASRELEREFPGALGIGYIARVPDDPESVEMFIAQARDDGAPEFAVTIPPGAAPLPGAATEDRYIIKYIEPLAVNRSARGLDIGAHPVRREAAERAMLTADGCLTGKIVLVQDDQQVAGFLYMLPFYEPGEPIDTPQQRAAALRGWVYMPMLGPEVFRDVMAVADGELDVEVFDGPAMTDQTLIFDADDHLSDLHKTRYSAEDFSNRLFHKTIEISIGGRRWTLSLSTTDAFAPVSRGVAWIVVLGGVVFSGLLSLLVYVQGNSTRRAWALAEGMTTELRNYADTAQQATLAKSQFLANMSHEIRTPMTAILGFAELMAARTDQDHRDVLEYTHTIKRNGEHLLNIINDILDLSKIEAGKIQVERIDTRPCEIISDVMSLMQVKAAEKRLPLTAELATPIPTKILGDPVRLRQILVNLVGNAIKFTDSGRVTLSIHHEDGSLRFDVIDTGRGMTPEQAGRVFGAFEQADQSTTRQFGGSGLGLHISRRLARMLDGDITFKTQAGKGSTFTATIATGVIDASDMIPAGPLTVISRHQPATAQPTPLDDKPLVGMRILLAEDGKDNQRLISFHLIKAGAVVKIVENGLLALEAMTVEGDADGPFITPPPFDLLLTDMQMPVMDGYTAVRRLRLRSNAMPVIALTAHAMADDAEKCLLAGCDAYASKPIDRDKLIRVCLETVEKTGQATAA